MSVRLVDPSSGQFIRSIPFHDDSEIEKTLAASSQAFNVWRRCRLQERLNVVATFEAAMATRREELARQISLEMGKVLREALAEVDKSITSCAQLRQLYPKWKSEREYCEGDYAVTYEALGPVLAIMPWNFPVWQVIRFAIPALMGGNSVILKHAPNTWGVAEMLTNIFAGVFPAGVFMNLFIDVDRIPKLVADSRLRGVSLTGSRRAGSRVGALAGEHLKKCVLELGGSDAYVILDDADIEQAAEICVQGRMVNAGQSCVAAKRFIVTQRNAKLFTEAVIERMRAVQWGAAMDPRSGVGPLARQDLRDGLHGQVEKSREHGARCVLGGVIPETPGFYYPPSVLTDVQPGHVAFDEELFGPVASIVTAGNEDEAVDLANLSRYGLGGAVFSRDVDRARRIAREKFESGMVFVNDFVRSDARVPFGGVKDSGLGRELGREGCFEFCNVKTVKS
jgi:succinate-semialdehyde dehydrogenase/glutarate-semialdehyde dehydrogenase